MSNSSQLACQPRHGSTVATMKPLKNKVVLRGATLMIGLFYGAIFVSVLLLGWLRNPWKKFWRVKRREIAPECLTDPARGDHCYAKLKNVKIHYVEKGDKKKPLILFVHGFPEFWYSWRNQMDALSKDYWVVALDMRGFGDSDKPERVEHYTLQHLVSDIKELVEYLGRDKFTLVAHDWGGVIAWAFVEAHPDMLDRYVIMDAPRMISWERLVLTQWKQFFMSWYIFFYQLPYLPELAMRYNDMGGFKIVFRDGTPKEKSLITDEDIEAYKYTFGKPGAQTGPINYYRANIFRSLNTLPASTRKLDVGVPGLLIYGEKDKYLDLQHVKIAEEDVADLTVKIVAGGTHYVQQDKPKAVNKLIDEFMRKK